jgi:hypothetical protein
MFLVGEKNPRFRPGVFILCTFPITAGLEV